MTTLLLTGAPGCGKTTLIRSVLVRLQRPAGGFYTQEVRHPGAGQKGARTGFEIVMLDGQRGRLAQVGYLVVVDEIGPMECFSASFRQAVLDLLEGGYDLMGTIVQRPHPFADQVKQRGEMEIIEVRSENNR